MEDRVIRLEEDMREVRSDQKAIRDLLTDIRIELSRRNPTQVPLGHDRHGYRCRAGDFSHRLRSRRLGSQGYLTPDFGCSPSDAPAINLRRR